MWYKRFWFAMVLVLAFGMLAAALAEEPVDPRRQEMMEYLQLTRHLEEEKTSSGNMGPEDDSGSMPRLGYGSIITISGTLKPEQTLTFRANTGRADNSSLVFNCELFTKVPLNVRK